MAFILTTANSSGSSSSSVSNSGIIPNNSTITVDSLGSTGSNTIKWTIELLDTTNEKIRSFEILAVNKFDIKVVFNKYGIIGDSILHEVLILLNGGNIDLNITNNENIDLNYKFTRTEI